MNIDCAHNGDGSIVIYCKLYSTLGIVSLLMSNIVIRKSDWGGGCFVGGS